MAVKHLIQVLMGKSFTNWMKFTHRWLGFITGLVIIVNLVPAAIFVFEKEISDWYYAKIMLVEPKTAAPLPLSALQQKVQQSLKPEEAITHINIKKEPNRAYLFGVYQENEEGGLSYFAESKVNKEVYINPYTGEILGARDLRTDWLKICEALHRRMLLHYSYEGHWVTAYMTLIIIFSLLTGLVLWYPRSKAAVKQRFTFKRNASTPRRVYDLHNVGGFYFLIPVLFLSITGLMWSFNWWADGMFRILGSNKQDMEPNYTVWQVDTTTTNSLLPLDKIALHSISKRDSWISLVVSLPYAPITEKSQYYAFLRFNDGSLWEESDQYIYNNVGLLKKELRHEDKSRGIKWDDSNYAFHTGSIYGMPTKLLFFFATLFCISLPITGFMIWYKRNYGKKKKTKNRRIKR